MNTLRFILILSYLSFFSFAERDLNSQPNFVFILVDDLGWQDIGLMGSDYYETPHIDELGEESVVFNQAYMYPTCSPSRAALLSGKPSFKTGVYTVPVLEKGSAQENIFSKWTVDLEHDFYSQPLNKAGYKLIHLGKWHVVGPNPELETQLPLKKKLRQPGNGTFEWLAKHQSSELQAYYPQGKGYHENVGGTWWGDPARGKKEGYNFKTGGYESPYGNPFIKERKDGEWLTDRLTDDAIDFMKRHKDKPFLVNLNYYTVHRPTVARSQDLLKKYQNKKGDSSTGQGPKLNNEIAAYATMVESLDDNVGRLVEFLNKSGLRENTILIFTSDNGHNRPSQTNNLRAGKGTIYEGGLRVPAFINWKGKFKPSRCDEYIQGIDYFPTLLDLANIKDYEKDLDGSSIVPLLEGKTLGERTLYWHIASRYKNDPCTVMRKGDWKLIQYLLNGQVELYNIKKDQLESNDLSESNPEKVKSLVQEMQQWRKVNNVPLPPKSKLPF